MVNVYPRGTHTYPKLSSLREDVFYSPCCTRKSLSPTLRRENRKKSSDAYQTIEIETAEVTFPRATKKEQETSERRLKLSGVCPPLAFITRNPLLFFFFYQDDQVSRHWKQTVLHSADSAPEAALISVQQMVLVVVYSLTVSSICIQEVVVTLLHVASLVSLLLPGVQKAKK